MRTEAVDTTVVTGRLGRELPRLTGRTEPRLLLENNDDGSWTRFNPPGRGLDPAFYAEPSFVSLEEPVQAALKVILALVPARASDAKQLIEDSTFTSLSAAEQKALLSPPKPDRLDHALAMIAQPMLSFFP